jgi:hypothetical protein
MVSNGLLEELRSREAECSRRRENELALRSEVSSLRLELDRRVNLGYRLETRIGVLRRALEKAHACATLRDDGTCGGCPVADALVPCEFCPKCSFEHKPGKPCGILVGPLDE